jgi:hypothetical protein
VQVQLEVDGVRSGIHGMSRKIPTGGGGGVVVAQLLPLAPLLPLHALQLDLRPQRSSLDHGLVVAKTETQTNDLQGNNPVFPPEPTPVHHPSSISSTSVMNSPSTRFISLSSVAYQNFTEEGFEKYLVKKAI